MECWPFFVWVVGAFLTFVGVAVLCGVVKNDVLEDGGLIIALSVASLWPICLTVVIVGGLFLIIKNAAAKILSHREQITTAPCVKQEPAT